MSVLKRHRRRFGEPKAVFMLLVLSWFRLAPAAGKVSSSNVSGLYRLLGVRGLRTSAFRGSDLEVQACRFSGFSG